MKVDRCITCICRSVGLPDVLVPLDIETVEVVIFDEALLLLLIFAVLQALHDRELHLHRYVDWQHRLQKVLLKAQVNPGRSLNVQGYDKPQDPGSSLSQP